jgi:hypothetical protein
MSQTISGSIPNCDTCINGELVGHYPDKCQDCGRQKPAPKPHDEPDPLPERAFPLAREDERFRYYNEGMELRDYFAAKAINGLINLDISNEQLASSAYEVADAMMEARKGKRNEIEM